MFAQDIPAICLPQVNSTTQGFSLRCHQLKRHTCKQCQGLKHQRSESELLVATLLSVLCSVRGSAAVCAAGYCGILPRLRRMDIADTRILCSAARRWGRHTVNCRQNRKAESCEICILTATVHKSVKSHFHARWCTENQERVRGRICEVILVKTDGWQKPHGGNLSLTFTPTPPNCTLVGSLKSYDKLCQRQNH